MSTEEAVWVARAKAGDQAAFAALFARYERRIYTFVYRLLGDAADADDLTQETFLKAYRALGRTDEALNVNAWLHKIAANTCLDALRRRRRIRWLPWEERGDAGLSPRRTDDPAERFAGDETQHAVQRVLAALAPRGRQALLLREYEGLAYEEIGAIMGLSPAAVKSLLFRSREEFRKVYQAMEGQPK